MTWSIYLGCARSLRGTVSQKSSPTLRTSTQLWPRSPLNAGCVVNSKESSKTTLVPWNCPMSQRCTIISSCRYGRRTASRRSTGTRAKVAEDAHRLEETYEGLGHVRQQIEVS